MSRRTLRSRRGFTLMEVLLVLSILVILGGTVSFFFIGVQKNAQMDAARTQISNYKTALDIYRLNVGMYPTDQEGLEALKVAPSSLANPAKWQGPYIEVELANDPWDLPYVYSTVQSGVAAGEMKPQIVSFGPDRTQGTEDDITM
jgi:general secretion pathway protein G